MSVVVRRLSLLGADRVIEPIAMTRRLGEGMWGGFVCPPDSA